jgi:hypothetical protein
MCPLLDGIDEVGLQPVQRLDREPDPGRLGEGRDLREARHGTVPLRHALRWIDLRAERAADTITT